MDRVTFNDVSLSDLTLEQLPRLQQWRERHFSTKPAICTELPLLITRYLRDLAQEADPPEVKAGKMYQYVLEHKTAMITEDNLLAGTTSTKPVGVMLYPDLYPLSLWPELETMADRKKNPFDINNHEINTLNLEVFPYWLERTVMEVTRKDQGNPLCQRIFERLVFYLVSKPETISHTIPHYGMVVERGLADIIREAQEEENKPGQSKEQKDFYQAVQLALQGIITYAGHLADEAHRQAGMAQNQKRRDELKEISRICRKVPAAKPETFHEALNAIWICKIALHQENANLALSLGRLDQILYPLYAQDIENKKMTVARALELVGCFWLSMADHVPMIPEAGEEIFGGSGSNQAITLGGVDREGEDAVNDLTYVMLRATELLALRDPNVNARYHYDKNSRQYLERLCRVNLTTLATPCFHNDVSVIDTLQEAYKDQGITPEDARDYGVVGCVEPASTGRTYAHSGAIFINLTAALEMALFGGKHRLTKDEVINPETQTLPGNMPHWQDFQKALEAQIGFLINQAVTFNDYAGATHQQIHRTPMLSALMEGCMKKGKDVICGGATYNSSGATIIGLAEVVDSVTAIQEFIYDKTKMTWADMLGAINANWKDDPDKAGKPYAKFHAWVKNSPEKFGRDSQMAKANADWLMKFMHDNFYQHLNYRGGHYNVGYWTMTNHAGFGRITGALPSGRQAGESFASGITPVSGSAPELTPCLNFVAHLDHRLITNGQALNIKYYPQTTTLKALADTIEAYFRTGGLQVQCNIIAREKLLERMQHPDNYPDEKLLVRVSGYTAYFQDLNPQMQQEIITRAEYDLKNGMELRYQDTTSSGESSSLFPRNLFTWKSLFVQLKDLQGRLRDQWNTFTSRRGLLRELEGEATKEFLDILLHLMELRFLVDSDYRENIKNFTGAYRIKDQAGELNYLVKFHNGKMDFTRDDPVSKADVTLTFDKMSTLRDLLLAIKTDVLQVILKNQVLVDGNYNYLYKFGFMANHPILPLLKLVNELS